MKIRRGHVRDPENLGEGEIRTVREEVVPANAVYDMVG